MIVRRRVEPAEFQQCVALLTHRIGTFGGARRESGPDYFGLQGALTALWPVSRSRTGVMLDGIAVGPAAENPAMAAAARYVRAGRRPVEHGGAERRLHTKPTD